MYIDFTKVSHIIKSTVLPIQFQHSFTQAYSLLLQSEQEWVNDNFNTGQENFYNQLITVIGSHSPDLSIAFRYEFSTNDHDPSGKKNWSSVEVGYNIGQTHKLTVSYGSERGGQICSNGVCRYIQPFIGFRLSLQSQI